MKFNRFVGVVAILIGIVGNAGFASVASAAPRLEPPRGPQSQTINGPALTVPPASSLGVQFLQVATAANTVSDFTTIDNPLTNGNPNAIIFVTPNNNPGGGVGKVAHNNPIGVFYTGTLWAIFNEDHATMVVGDTFNVIVPTPGPNVFVDKAVTVSGDGTVIDNPLTNGNANAILLVTSNYNPGNGSAVYDPHPVGVYYNNAGHWEIIHEDQIGMVPNASFNVFVLPPGAGVFVQIAAAGNIAIDGITILDNPLTNGNPNALVFATPNFNPGGGAGRYDGPNIGVYYNSFGRWTIFNMDLTPITAGLSFNVLVLVPALDAFVHTASASNSVTFVTKIDNALTNGHPNAIAFTTQNLSAGGGGATYDPHPTGVYYYSGQWTIFNEDAATMPAGAAFNVIIPASGANVFVDLARTVASDYTVLDNPLTNGNPNAIVFATPNWNPGGVGGVTDNNPIGVYYTTGHWTIFNESGVNMPLNAAFNVFVPRPGANVFVHKAHITNPTYDFTIIDNPLTNGHPNAILVVTPNYNPGAVGGTYNNHPIGVGYLFGYWVIINQDTQPMLDGAAFNVLVYDKLYLPLVVR